jgi:DNA-binding response OmpR family regulator
MSARILLIDDDAAVRESLRLVLEASGHQVRSADSGDSGLDAAGDFHPDIILTDIIMPGCEGIETIMTLKTRYPAIRIIAMSGGGRVGNRDYLDLARDVGADAVLQKPFDADAILDLVQAHLRR